MTEEAFFPSADFCTKPVALAQAMIRCRSVTPADDGAQACLKAALQALGFVIHDLPFGPKDAPTPNFYARRGQGRPRLCFAGHTDVVPPGADWTYEPFEAVIHEGHLYGRGIADMKGGLACSVAAVARLLAEREPHAAIAFLVTGDEEGPAHHGTQPMMAWLSEQDDLPEFCLLGEPTNPSALGETIKIGRRGSLNARIVVQGVQGHVAYPHRADNPIHRLLAVLQDMTTYVLDTGTEWFAPSSLQVTSVDVGNTVTNVIPAEATACLNIRFNDHHTGASLEAWLRACVARHAPKARVDVHVSGEAFLTAPGPAVEELQQAIQAVTGRVPTLDTGGGTSDARFISRYCPVAEFGLVGATMHQKDEHVSLDSLENLTEIYRTFMQRFGL